MDLSGTAALHGAPPAAVLARFSAAGSRPRWEITVSVGLAGNRLLAKIAAGQRQAARLFRLGSDAQGRIRPGAGRRAAGRGPGAGRGKLKALGITQGRPSPGARRPPGSGPARRGRARPGAAGARRGRAPRAYQFDHPVDLERSHLRQRRCRPRRARAAPLADGREAGPAPAREGARRRRGGAQAENRAVRHPHSHPAPARPDTASGGAVRRRKRPCSLREADGTAFRLIGIGANPLTARTGADRGDLADLEAPRRQARWRAVEALRAKFGEAAVIAGRSIQPRKT